MGHFFGSPCILWWRLKLLFLEDAYSHCLHLLDFSPSLFVFLKGISSLTPLSQNSSSIIFWSIKTKKGMLSLATASLKLRKDCRVEERTNESESHCLRLKGCKIINLQTRPKQTINPSPFWTFPTWWEFAGRPYRYCHKNFHWYPE